MLRRDFLQQCSALGIAISFPSLLKANSFFQGKTLVLIELKGGNDGLNTLIPYSNPLYYVLRNKLAIKKNDVLKIDNKVGFHPSLEKMAELYKNGELACLQGVGYPNPNRSHFRSIEIWESASQEYLDNGWITEVLHVNKNERTLDGLVFGKNSLGPMFGQGLRTLVVDEPNKFIKSAKYLKTQKSEIKIKNKALAHLLKSQEEIENSKEMFTKKLISTNKFKNDGFGKSSFAKAMYNSARVIVSDMNIPVIKVSLGSFDTHSNQFGKHANLLKNLSDSLYEFRRVLKEQGKWDDVLVMTYSEFGRRVSENASKGSDHGKASVHFMAGGKVKGGLYGEYPSIEKLDNGDLKYNLDFRTIYNTIVTNWWGIESPDRLKNFGKIENLI